MNRYKIGDQIVYNVDKNDYILPFDAKHKRSYVGVIIGLTPFNNNYVILLNEQSLDYIFVAGKHIIKYDISNKFMDKKISFIPDEDVVRLNEQLFCSNCGIIFNMEQHSYPFKCWSCQI